MKEINRIVGIALTLCATFVSCSEKQSEPSGVLKPRIVIMTDIGPAEVEPDNNESTVRLLSYADRFEIEGIITTIGWNCDPYPIIPAARPTIWSARFTTTVRSTLPHTAV